MKKLGFSIAVVSTLVLATSGCGKGLNISVKPFTNLQSSLHLGKTTPTKVSFFLTNDMHGHVENMALMGGLVKAYRDQPEYKNGDSAFLVVDSGDQFQGTLTSNYDEGSTVFKILNEIGYDAIIPGNHDYDFGPKNWQYDRVTPGVTGSNPREVIESLSGMAKFPMLSANTYLKASIKIAGTQTVVPVDDSCVPTNQTVAGYMDFAHASQPSFLAPFKIINRAGVRIALIGIDHHQTTSITTGENVSDLCFRDEAAAYLDVRKVLQGRADVFVMLMHNGNILPDTFSASDIAQTINTIMPGAVDLVAAGHTHQVHNNLAGKVHVMQDGANAIQYGRVDLYFDPVTGKVLTDKTNSWAGMSVKPDTCDTVHAGFACSQLTLPVAPLASIETLVAAASQSVDTIGKQKLGTATAEISKARTGESPLGNIMSDALRKGAQTQVAFMNAGGIRINLKKGDILYENLFEVTPFGNLVVVMDALPWKNLKAILQRTISTNGAFGTLMQSGLKIQYTATDPDTVTQLFKKSELLHVELLDGTVLFDKAQNIEVAQDYTVTAATLDFLALGGDGFDFTGVPVSRKMKIARDVIADEFLAETNLALENKTDGRFVNAALQITSDPAPAPSVAPVATPAPAPAAPEPTAAPAAI
jgi:5'-nucleotidase/UDP-sugar diphosphatase